MRAISWFWSVGRSILRQTKSHPGLRQTAMFGDFRRRGRGNSLDFMMTHKSHHFSVRVTLFREAGRNEGFSSVAMSGLDLGFCEESCGKQ
jgi:hypothetical protein